MNPELAFKASAAEVRVAIEKETCMSDNGGDLGSGRSDFGSLGFSGPDEGGPTPVPEPASLLLLATGVIDLAVNDVQERHADRVTPDGIISNRTQGDT